MNKLVVVKEKVKERLDGLKLCERDTYNEVIERLLDGQEDISE